MKNVPGRVLAIDARTGALAWRFNTIPEKGEFGYDTWENGSAEYTGNAGAWAPLTLDAKRGYLYLPVEAATGDYYGGHRLGDDLFSSTLVCLDARTGKRVWHFQIVHHDIWDRDNAAAPILADITVNGQRVEAVVQLTKQAYAYVFDRVTGKPVWPIVERPMPASDVPGRACVEDAANPDEAGGVRSPGRDASTISSTSRRSSAPKRSRRSSRTGSPRAPFTPPSVANGPDGTRGHVDSSRHPRRRELGRRRVRSGDGHAVRRIVDLARGVRSEQGRALRHGLGRHRRAAARARPAAHQAAVQPHHRDRSEHRRARVDGAERRHAARYQEQPGARGPDRSSRPARNRARSCSPPRRCSSPPKDRAGSRSCARSTRKQARRCGR